MLKHFILIFFRNFKRYKSASLINLFGLSVGLASTLLIYLWVNDELNMGNFKEKDSDRHYQILKSYVTSNGYHTDPEGYTPNPLADAMNQEFPEVDYAIPVISMPFHQGVLVSGENNVKAMPKYVGPGYFNVFPAKFIEGDKANVLTDKSEIVISEQMAMSLFQSTKAAMGQTVTFQNDKGFYGTHVVTGVFERSRNDLAQFDVIFSYELFRGKDMMNWQNGGTQVHLVMNPDVDIDEFNEKIKWFLATKQKNTKEMLFAQRYSDRYLYGNYENGQPVEGRIGYVRLFSLIAIFVLAIASINYMNFSTAKAARRVKEIGVKKAIGAKRKNLVLQHFGESMLMSLLSLAIAIVFVLLLLPKFNEVINPERMLEITPNIIAGFLAITIVTGLLSGIYPAIHLSGFGTVVALKGKMSGGSGALWLRKGLVIFQFGISVILIVSVLVIYKQIEYIQTANLGYTKDHIVTFAKEGKLKKDFEAFLTEVKKVPGVINASQMKGILPGRIDFSGGFQWQGQEDRKEAVKVRFYQIRGGYDLIELLGIKLKEGRTFSRDYPSDETAMILNQSAIDVIKYEDPIGARFYGNNKMHNIIGVVEDFHYESFREKVGPFVFSLSDNGDHFLVKMRAGTERETVDRVQELYQTFNPGYAFDFKFMDENYQAVYAEEERITVLSRYFAGVAIAISCLGLLALTAFSTQRRFKEIAIRKVLGSSRFGIINLLSREFIVLVILAIVVALPVVYYLMINWLDSFAYRISLTPVYFILASLLMLIMAWLTVIAQTSRSSKVNVSESLRRE